MKNLIYCLMLCATVVQAQQTTSQTRTANHAPLKVGNEYAVHHQYTTTGQTGVVYEQEFYNKNSAYVKLYFEDFNLGPEDYLEISTHNTGESVIYAGQGKIVDNEGTTISDFWAMGLFDDRVTVRLHAVQPSNNYGFKITQVAYGYPQAQIDAMLATEKSICGSDNKQRVACVSGTMATRSRAVCRLLINGSAYCTGWLLGSQGHLMTNNHCIGSSSDAQNTDFRFNYQYSQCSGGGLAISNTVATSSTFIKTNSSLDYTLVRLPNNPTNTYGYLQLSPNAVSVGTRIYIPQHPGGRPKEIATIQDQNGSGPAVVATSSTSGVRYYADTEGGSSGSPVLDYNTHQVVAIHNTGGCTNGSRGRSDRLISSIGSDMPTNGVAGGSTGGGGTGGSNCAGGNITDSWDSNFENWVQYIGDDFNWSRRSGSTPSRNTGPSSAYNGSHYIYMESSFPNYSQKSAVIRSPCYDISSGASLSFHYHMYGASNMGSLYLQVKVNGGSWTTIWNRSGNQGNFWNYASINLNSYTGSNVQFRFYGITGTTWQGDMAVDYFRITGNAESAPVESANLEANHYLNVAPNPFNNVLNIQTDLGGTPQYRITNLQGQIVQEGNLPQSAQLHLSNDLASGVYFITLYNDQERLTQKVIKQ